MFFRTRGAAYFSHAEKSGALVSVWKSLRPGAKGRRHSDFLYYSLCGEIVKGRGLCRTKFFDLIFRSVKQALPTVFMIGKAR